MKYLMGSKETMAVIKEWLEENLHCVVVGDIDAPYWALTDSDCTKLMQSLERGEWPGGE